MSKFDDEVNDILTRKLIKKRKLKAMADGKDRAPKPMKSPAVRGGVVGSKEIASTPMPLQIGV